MNNQNEHIVVTKENIIEIINNYTKILYIIKSKFELYKCLKEKKTHFSKVYESISSSFKLIQDSLGTDIIMSLSKIYDLNICLDKNSGEYKLEIGRNSGFNILYLLRKIKEVKNCIDIEESISLISRKKDIIISIKRWRDKYIAHSDKEYFLNPSLLTLDAPLHHKDFEELITLSITIFNKCSSHLGGAYCEIDNYFVKNEVDFIFNTLKKSFEDYEKKRKEALARTK